MDVPRCSSSPVETVHGSVIPTYKQITQSHTSHFSLGCIIKFHLIHQYIGLLKPHGQCHQVIAASVSMYNISQVHPGIRRAFVSVRLEQIGASHCDCTL